MSQWWYPCCGGQNHNRSRPHLQSFIAVSHLQVHKCRHHPQDHSWDCKIENKCKKDFPDAFIAAIHSSIQLGVFTIATVVCPWKRHPHHHHHKSPMLPFYRWLLPLSLLDQSLDKMTYLGHANSIIRTAPKTRRQIPSIPSKASFCWYNAPNQIWLALSTLFAKVDIPTNVVVGSTVGVPLPVQGVAKGGDVVTKGVAKTDRRYRRVKKCCRRDKRRCQNKRRRRTSPYCLTTSVGFEGGTWIAKDRNDGGDDKRRRCWLLVRDYVVNSCFGLHGTIVVKA